MDLRHAAEIGPVVPHAPHHVVAQDGRSALGQPSDEESEAVAGAFQGDVLQIKELDIFVGLELGSPQEVLPECRVGGGQVHACAGGRGDKFAATFGVILSEGRVTERSPALWIEQGVPLFVRSVPCAEGIDVVVVGIVHHGDAKVYPGRNFGKVGGAGMLSEFHRGLSLGDQIGEVKLVIPSFFVVVAIGRIHHVHQLAEGGAGLQLFVALLVGGHGPDGLLVAFKKFLGVVGVGSSGQRHEGVHDVLVLDEILAQRDERRNVGRIDADVHVKSHRVIHFDFQSV
mmetsp:Transcript_35625/g.82791  ORF Transcript_35625/g.82791 Transcript_35625/m.82791 type:complete len:285 (+) Transcript_35625:1994-2848(+)